MNACVHLATCICVVLQSAAGLGMGALCGHSIASPAPVSCSQSTQPSHPDPCTRGDDDDDDDDVKAQDRCK